MKNNYSICRSVCDNPAFAEASAEELRVIIAITEQKGYAVSEEELAKIAGISLPRARSAIAFWEGSGIIKISRAADGNIEEEFNSSLLDSDTAELSGREAAREIRDRSLRDMIEEAAALLGKPALHTEDVKRLVALHTEYGLDSEFILTLLAHLVSKSESTTVAMLVRRAKTLYEKSINTPEKLEAYIKDTEEQIAGEMELRRMLGIYRPLTKTQREFAKKWLTEYGFGLDIIGEAYDITVSNIDKVSFAYMDTMITGWHESDCRTVEDCRRKTEADRQAKKPAKANKASSKKTEEKPRYGNFDPEEVFKRALERSYGDKK